MVLERPGARTSALPPVPLAASRFFRRLTCPCSVREHGSARVVSGRLVARQNRRWRTEPTAVAPIRRLQNRRAHAREPLPRAGIPRPKMAATPKP